MSLKSRNIVARWFKEFWGPAWNPGIVDELATPSMYLRHSMHEPRNGRPDVLRFMMDFRASFPDLSFWAVGDPIVDGDYVAQRWEGNGTHTGPAFSGFRMGSVAANSRRRISYTGTTVFRLDEGRIAEEHGQEDALRAMQQLSLIRAPEIETRPPERLFGELPRGWNNMKS
jgi:predicted ester cyclase